MHNLSTDYALCHTRDSEVIWGKLWQLDSLKKFHFKEYTHGNLEKSSSCHFSCVEWMQFGTICPKNTRLCKTV